MYIFAKHLHTCPVEQLKDKGMSIVPQEKHSCKLALTSLLFFLLQFSIRKKTTLSLEVRAPHQ